MSSHRTRTILLDAQLLVLLVVGRVSRAYIGKHKRLRAYREDDFEQLAELLADPARSAVTPNVLSEASNLLAQIADPARTEIFSGLRRLIGHAVEIYVPSGVAAAHPAFTRLGLADAACLTGEVSDALLLTADTDLYLAALSSGRKVLNFWHVREENR